MRKTSLILGAVALFLTFSAVKSHATIGIGVIAGEPTGLSLKIGGFPVMHMGWSPLYNRVDLTVDAWLFNPTIRHGFQWYLGIGAKVHLALDNTITDRVGFGVRVPIGLQLWVWKFEIFLEGAPGVAILPAVGFDWGAGIGIRFHV